MTQDVIESSSLQLRPGTGPVERDDVLRLAADSRAEPRGEAANEWGTRLADCSQKIIHKAFTSSLKFDMPMLAIERKGVEFSSIG